MTASGPNTLPAYVYDSARRRPRWIEEAGNLWQYRSLVHELVIRDIKVRYKRSVLGMVWTMLAPLLNMIALTLVFAAILKTAISNYPVYFMAGQIFWAFFSQTTVSAASQTQASNDLAKRMFVPRSVFVAAADHLVQDPRHRLPGGGIAPRPLGEQRVEGGERRHRKSADQPAHSR